MRLFKETLFFAIRLGMLSCVVACSYVPSEVHFPSSSKAFVLIHGWQGDKGTFGDLEKYLAEDYPNSDV